MHDLNLNENRSRMDAKLLVAPQSLKLQKHADSEQRLMHTGNESV